MKIEKTKKKEQCNCRLCRAGGDTRPRVHTDDEPATDEVLQDMAVRDAMDEYDS